MLRLKRLAIVVWLFALCAALAAGGRARAECDRDRFPVAVDIGHTPEDPGATSARGIPEFAFNMALGRDAAAALGKAGFPVHRIIVSGRGKEQLSRRVAAAQALSPALVISIHHDSVQEQISRGLALCRPAPQIFGPLLGLFHLRLPRQPAL